MNRQGNHELHIRFNDLLGLCSRYTGLQCAEVFVRYSAGLGQNLPPPLFKRRFCPQHYQQRCIKLQVSICLPVGKQEIGLIPTLCCSLSFIPDPARVEYCGEVILKRKTHSRLSTIVNRQGVRNEVVDSREPGRKTLLNCHPFQGTKDLLLPFKPCYKGHIGLARIRFYRVLPS